MVNSKLIGGTLLMIGTTIGAGMLALPIATAKLGFPGAVLLFILCWLAMVTCAFLFLEAVLWLPFNSNMISMAGATLGRLGQIVTWVVYLVLLYSILSSYVAGGGDLFHYLLAKQNIHVSNGFAACLFTLLFGTVVYFGIKSVDYVNRGLMFGKLGALLVLILLMLPHVNFSHLDEGSLHYFLSPSSITVTAVAFGSLMIIPSLRAYFGKDLVSLKKAIFIGMFIPLLCYIGWDLVISGVIPYSASPGLIQIAQSDDSNSLLLATVSLLLNKKLVTILAQFFTSICMTTSFLSISLSLSDFLSDGLRTPKEGWGLPFIMVLTFLPPLVIENLYPDAFLRGLNYAGVCCFILMMLLPPLMVWSGRYYLKLPDKHAGSFTVPGGKPLLCILIALAIFMIILGVNGLF